MVLIAFNELTSQCSNCRKADLVDEEKVPWAKKDIIFEPSRNIRRQKTYNSCKVTFYVKSELSRAIIYLKRGQGCFTKFQTFNEKCSRLTQSCWTPKSVFLHSKRQNWLSVENLKTYLIRVVRTADEYFIKFCLPVMIWAEGLNFKHEIWHLETEYSRMLNLIELFAVNQLKTQTFWWFFQFSHL